MKYLEIIVIIFCLLPQIFSLRPVLQSNEDRGRSRRLSNSNNIIYAEETDDNEELNEGNIISLFKSMVDVLRKKHLVGVDDDFNSFTNTRKSTGILENTELVRKRLSLPKFRDGSNSNINSIGEAQERSIVAFQQVPMAYVPVFYGKLNEFVDTATLPGGKEAYFVRGNNKNHFNNLNNVKLNLGSSFRVHDNNNFERKNQQESPDVKNQGDDRKQDYGIRINEFDDQWEMEKYPVQNDNDNMPHEPPSNNQNRHHSFHNTGQLFGGRSLAYDTNYKTANMRNVNP